MERPKYYKEAWYFQPSQNHKALEIQLEKNPIAVIKPSPAFLLCSKLHFSCTSHSRIQGLLNWNPGVGQTPKRHPYFNFKGPCSFSAALPDLLTCWPSR